MIPNLRRLALVWALCACASRLPAQTATPATFLFVSWGDGRGTSNGAVNTIDMSALSQQIHVFNPAFTIFAGDLCAGWNSSCTSTGQNGWEYAVNGGSANDGLFNITFPFRGNHDTSASLWDSYFAGRFPAMVTAIGGSNFNFYSADGPERTYSFDYANSHIVGIDMPGGDITTMTSGQISWLDSDITAAEARGVTHTFIMDHGPIYYVDGHPTTPPASIIAVMNKHTSISATFHGHEHVLAHVHVDSAHIPGVTHPWEEFITGAAGAPLYSCTASRLIGPTDYCEGNSFGFMTVAVNGNTITVSAYLEGQTTPAQQWTFTTSSTPPPPDTTPPTVTAFSIPATSTSLTVPITTFTATDNVGVTGYMVTETSAAPAASAAGWTTSPPTSHTFATAGTKTLYAWAKDAAGNVSAGMSGSVTITLADTTPPMVTLFAIPATSSSLTVPITSFAATDNVGVTGYMVTETSTAPAASAAGWTASPPTSHTFATAGTKTLWAWAKDAAGNVSAGVSATTTITIPTGGPPDTTPPTVTAFTIPAASTSLTVPITTFTATDNVGVTGYMVTETSTAPTANAAGWAASPPASHTFATAGAKTLWAWAKDAAGNVSAGVSATTTVTIPTGGPPDTTPPMVTAFTIPAASASLTVPITTFTATDNVGVTGYMVTETSAAPAAGATGWTTSPPTSHAFATAGAKTLWSWAKDAAGNVSAGVSATTTISMPTGGGPGSVVPVVTSFTLAPTTSGRTVQITSFTATDVGKVTGYMVTQTSKAPHAGSSRWKESPPTKFKFKEHVSGSVTLYGWAKDAAGDVSLPASATTTVSGGDGDGGDSSGDSDNDSGSDDDGSGGDSSGKSGDSSSATAMDVWVSNWLAVSIQTGSAHYDTGFLRIRSWNSGISMLQATLFTHSVSTGNWQSLDLALQVNGTPQEFLASFDHADEFQFGAKVNATVAAGRLQSATLMAAGNSHTFFTEFLNSGTEDKGLVAISGALVPESSVPAEIRH